MMQALLRILLSQQSKTLGQVRRNAVTGNKSIQERRAHEGVMMDRKCSWVGGMSESSSSTVSSWVSKSCSGNGTGRIHGVLLTLP